MLRRFRHLLLILLIVVCAVYVVITNDQTITVNLAGNPYTANIGVFLLTSFGSGLICATFIALFFGLKAFLRERKLVNRDRERIQFYDGVLAARGFTASEEWEKARVQWEKILKKDPTNIIARIELSRSLEGAGELKEALKIIDEARGVSPQNVEVLFRAAELNLLLKNKTAALDNLALILYHQPNVKAALLARDISEQIERIDDALEYQEKLTSLGVRDQASTEVAERLAYKQVIKNASGEGALLEQIREFLRSHPEHPDALQKLAEIEGAAGNTELAAQYLIRAAKRAGSPTLWHQVAKLWISDGKPDKAISSAKSAFRGAEGKSKIYAQLELARLYVSLNMSEDAQKELDFVATTASEEGVTFDSDLTTRVLLIKGLAANARGDTRAAQDIWEKLCDERFVLTTQPIGAGSQVDSTGPAARLSTP